MPTASPGTCPCRPTAKPSSRSRSGNAGRRAVSTRQAKRRFAAGSALPASVLLAVARAVATWVVAAVCAVAPAGAQVGTPAGPLPAPATTTETMVYSPRADAVAIAIYRDNLALITETRTVDLPDSAITLVIEGVVGTLLPQSAVIADIARPLAEANFDFDR